MEPDGDFLIYIKNAIVLKEEAENELTESVISAYAAGHSWTSIAECFGVSRQAINKKYGPLLNLKKAEFYLWLNEQAKEKK